MAFRILLQKFSSRVCNSTSLLGSHAIASARAGARAPITSSAPEGATGALGNLFHGAAVRPGKAVPSNHGIHGYASGCFKSPYSDAAAAESSRPLTGVPSITAYPRKPTLPSSASTKHELSWQAKLEAEFAAEEAASRARGDAKRKAWVAEHEAWASQLSAKGDSFNRYLRNMIWLCTFTGFCSVSLYESWSSRVGKSSNYCQSVPGPCSSCIKRQSGGSKS